MVSITPEAFAFNATISNREFSVPLYQRSFTWRNDEVDDFIASVFFSEGAVFLGPMIFLDTGTSRIDGLDVTQFEVVDGQQRLTMLFTALAVLKNHLFEIADATGGPSSEASSLANFLQGEIFLDRAAEQRPRFTGREESVTAALRKHVFPVRPESWPSTRRGVTNTQGFLNLKKAHLRMQERIEKIKEESGADWPPKARLLAEKIRSQVYILKLEVRNVYDAYEIFVSMNSLGKPLAATDLMKTQLLRKEQTERGTTQENLQRINDAWDTARSNVKNANLDNYMRHALCMQLQTRVTKADMLRKFLHGSVEKLEDGTEVTHTFLLPSNVDTAIRIRDLGDEYGRIEGLRGGFNSPRIDRLFHYLENLVDTHRIYSLKVMIDNSTIEDKVPLIDAALTLAVRWVITEGNKQVLENIWISAVKDFDLPGGSAISRLEFLRSKLPSDADFTRALQGSSGSDLVRKTVLLILEEHLRSDSATPPSLDGNEVHLEHIAPRNPTESDQEDWMKAMRDIPENENYESVVANWGNLTLLAGSENKRLKTAPFLVKRDGRPSSNSETGGYRSSTLKINEYFLSHEKWNFAKINKRRTYLQDLALTRFQISSLPS